MTATTVLGQRTKNSLEGRNAKKHGFPIKMAEMLAPLDGGVYVARGATNCAAISYGRARSRGRSRRRNKGAASASWRS